ncbi:serine hydrolase [Undibacterium flavidum]|uniref:Serine hydrolase n=1 Tax=Undibacterium flavidum TaxID=2762297 RepID=A0ABR6YF76_9BURK|nr:serine hydrolase [Undibacterium flavidum]MBC3875134.1 serine hydrolase [Undibacterium flavidum]
MRNVHAADIELTNTFGAYTVGFERVQHADSTRVFHPKTDSNSNHVAKPVAIGKQQDSQQLDRLVSSYYKAHEPGATVIVVKDGKTILRKAYGMSSLAEKRRMHADDVLRIGSITKQFTAVAIMMLVEQGKISLNDTVSKILPDYPKTGKKITVEHLLTHTSGIPNYTEKPDFKANSIKDISVNQMLDTFKNDPLEFEPGSHWIYSNSGYFLLGALIEKVSGETYAKFMEKNVFVPLDMKNTAYEGFERTKQKHAAGHSRDGSRFSASTPLSMSQPYAGGSLISTVDDMKLWDAAISTGKLLNAQSWKRVFTEYKLSNGKGSQYGYGWFIRKLEDSPMISHGGGINGFTAFALRLPEEKVYVAVLTNSDGGLASPAMVANRLAAKLIGKSIPNFKAIKLDAKTMDKLTGMYKIDDKNQYNFVREGDKFIMSSTNGPTMNLQAYSETGFFYDTNSLTRIEFIKNVMEEGIKVIVYQNGDISRFSRTYEALPKEVAVPLALLDTYVGDYQLTPKIIISIRRDGTKFIGQATGQLPVVLTATAQDTFISNEAGAKVVFQPAADGSVPQLLLTYGGDERPAVRIKNSTTKIIKEVKVAPAIFDTYVGKYQIAPDFILTVSRNGDRYYTQATGQDVVEISAIADNVFLAKSFNGQLKFEKDANGKTSHLIMTQHGRNTNAKKLQ